MKKKYIAIAFLFMLSVATSCKKDFVDLLPEDSVAPDKFYQTDEQLQQAAIAIYVPLRDMLVNDYHTSEMRSDNTHYLPNPVNRGTATVYRENVSDWNNDANNDYVNAVYYHCYTGISRANILIGRIPNAARASAEGKTKADGQAKFLRAFFYFKLVRLFGGVPLYLAEVTKADEAFKDRATVEQVYAQIIADATDALNELKAPGAFPQTGEATKGSATMLLADVYATLKRYAEAEVLLNTLPGMGYGLNATYAQAFLPTNKNSKESLFEVQYLEGNSATSQPNAFIFQFMPKTTTTVLITGNVPSNTSGAGWNIPSFDLLADYEANDQRLPASVGIAEGTWDASFIMRITAVKSPVGYTTPAGLNSTAFIKKYVHGPYTVASNSGENWPIYRYAEALLLLAEVLNEQGKSPLVPLNAVRRRAGLLTDVTTNSQVTLRDIIMHERRVELAFENKRFNDLQRMPNGLAIMQAYGVKAKATYSHLESNAFSIESHEFIYPIPLPERNLNPGMKQNPGYAF